MRLNDFTALGRSIDFSFPTNRAIALLVLVTALAGAALHGDAGQGLQDGLAVFFAWALARELDPDHDMSAFVAVAFLLVGLLLWGVPLQGCFWLLLVIRVVNRTTGLTATPIDSLIVLALALTLRQNWGVMAISSVAFGMDAVLAPAPRRQFLFAAVGLGLTVMLVIQNGPVVFSGAAALFALLLSLPLLVTSREVTSLTDATDQKMQPLRIRAGLFVAALAGVEMALWSGAPGLLALMPLWAAVLGTATYQIWRRDSSASKAA